MTKALKAGTIYFALVFAAGFALGIVRVLLVVPLLGESAAVLIEAPIILAISWVVCGRLLDLLAVARRWDHRLLMGATAFSLLIIAEFVLARFALDRSIDQQLETYRTWSGLIGLGKQLIFAAFPVIRAGRGSPR